MGERTAQRQLVAVDLAPGPRLVAALREAWDGGPAVAPLPRGLPPRARVEVLAALRASRLVSERGAIPLPGPLAVAEDVALVVATSGSTGAPKGVALSRGALEASAIASLARLGGQRSTRWLCCLPLSSMGGIGVLTRSFLSGTDPVVLRRFTPEGVAEAGGVDAVSLVPTMLARLLDAGVDLARFRHVLLGGAEAPPALLARARAAGAALVTTYGLTETCGGCVYDGVPLDGVEVDIAGAGGRVRIRGPVLAEGYRAADGDGGAVTGADGWLVTNDLGRFAADGRLEVLGRADDVIVTGGVNVVAGRVAALLAEHPAVAQAAVLGVGDPEWGERVVAVIVPRDPAAPPDLPTLRAFLAERSPAATAPRQLLLTDHLPLLANGKLDRLALRARASEHR